MNDAEGDSPSGDQNESTPKKIDFKKHLVNLRGRFLGSRRHAAIQEPVPEPSIPEEEPQPKGIADFIKEEIAKKGLKPPEFKNQGSSGFGGTNERVVPDTLLEVAKSPDAPNGYLIGVGVSNILTLLDTFSDGVSPKGIVLINPDPAVTLLGQKFVEILSSGKQPLIGLDGSVETSSYPISKFRDQNEYMSTAYGEKLAGLVDMEAVIDRHHETLVNLARSGNIAVVQQDLFNLEMLEILSRLPDLKISNNIVYLSNVADWIWRPIGRDIRDKRTDLPQSNQTLVPKDPDMNEIFQGYRNLEVLMPDPPHLNYYADTLEKKVGGLGYHLRVQPKIPAFSRDDFDG